MERPYRSQNEDFIILIICSLFLISYFLFSLLPTTYFPLPITRSQLSNLMQEIY
jgi:hypothetical protein